MNKIDLKIIAIEKIRSCLKMDEILPGLFLAGLREARNTELLENYQIMAVVSIYDNSRDYYLDPKIDLLRIHLADVPQTDVLSFFSSVNCFIHSNRLNNSKHFKSKSIKKYNFLIFFITPL